MLPAPIVFPSDQCPVCAGIVVRLFVAFALPAGTDSRGSRVGVPVEAPFVPGAGGAAWELVRECPGIAD